VLDHAEAIVSRTRPLEPPGGVSAPAAGPVPAAPGGPDEG
jgi:hypothetical protein